VELVLVGLGKMGAGMAKRLVAGGHTVFGCDPNEAARGALRDLGGTPLDSLSAVRDRVKAPRAVWVMVPAGGAVDSVLDTLVPMLDRGDIVIDGGNSYYKDSMRRAERLRGEGLHFVDCGVSGGVWGASEGFCLMAGGDEAALERLRPILTTLAPAPDRGWGRVGPCGAGHFVKMVHNGIEYGMMQAYAEGFAIMGKKEAFAVDLAQVSEIWRHGSVVRSWLLDLTQRALAESPDLDGIAPWVADSGEGRWTVAEAVDLDVPAPVLTLALLERLSSREKDSFAYKLLAAMRNQFGGHAVHKTEAPR